MIPRLVTVSGVAGAGKDAIIGGAMPELIDMGFVWAPTVTTRSPRAEDNREAYIYVSNEEFLARVAEGSIMEYTTVTGNLYGTKSIDDMDAVGAIKIVTVDGFRSIMDWMLERDISPYDNLFSIYVTVPRDQAYARLISRGWTSEMIEERNSFTIDGYSAESVDPFDFDDWSLMLPNPDGGLDVAIDEMLSAVRGFVC